MVKGDSKSRQAATGSGTTSQLVKPFDGIVWGLSEEKLVFRLLHFWEARNPNKGGLLIGLELLLIDEKSTVIQGFVAPNCIPKFGGLLKANSIYSLTSFFATPNKNMYRVSDHKYTVCFTENSILSELAEHSSEIDTHRFRLRSFEQFEQNADRRGDLYDVLGHMKLINGQALNQLSPIDADGGSQGARVTVHLQPKDGPVLSLYLWDKTASEFTRKLAAASTVPSVLLVTTVNPKKIGRRLSLASMSSSRVFFDNEVLPAQEYLAWFRTQELNLPTMDSSQIVKFETLTIGDIQKFIKTEAAQKATFNCVATIQFLELEQGWYYVGCSRCSTKVTKGPTTLVCHKCDNPNAMAVIRYKLVYSVKDDECEAAFVFLDDAGSALIGRKAAELIDDYIRANGDVVQGEEIPIPTCLSEVCGQTHKFELKITEYNFRASRQTFTVGKILKEKTAPDCDAADVEEPAGSHPQEVVGNASNGNVSSSSGRTAEAEVEKLYGTASDPSHHDSKRLRILP